MGSNDAPGRNVEWKIGKPPEGGQYSWDAIQTLLLLDIREELRRLRVVLECPNFTALPREITAIRRNVATLTRIAKENETT